MAVAAAVAVTVAVAGPRGGLPVGGGPRGWLAGGGRATSPPAGGSGFAFIVTVTADTADCRSDEETRVMSWLEPVEPR